MICRMDTLRRMANAIQWDISSKKRTRPDERILDGSVVRIDDAHISVVGVGNIVSDLRSGGTLKVVDDRNSDGLKDLKVPEDIAHACIPLEPVKQWLSAFNSDNLHIHIKNGSVLIRSEIDHIDVAGLVAVRIEHDTED